MTILPGALTIVVLLIALIHAYWGIGAVWPSRDSRTLARAVVGARGVERMPSPAACYAVACLLLVVAVWPLVLIELVPFPGPDWLIYAVGTAMGLVFFLRGLAAYVPAWRRRMPEQPFATLDRRLFGPLCIALGIGYFALVLRGFL